MSPSVPRGGALVISLDFELHWGVRDHSPLTAAERDRLLAARAVVPGILNVFREYAASATWATVGLLFARSREEALAFGPKQRPGYRQTTLDAYAEPLGRDEDDDPFHFAPSLIREIQECPGQELGSHSYSHYYSLEEGQTAEDFGNDLTAAQAIAEQSGYKLESYVFPRNQVRRAYLPLLAQAGFRCYRGTEPAASKAPVTFREQRRPMARLARLADAYWDVNGAQSISWPEGENPAPVDSSRYLRPFMPSLRALEGKRLERIARAMRSAAAADRIFHLWWHPEDFAFHQERNLNFLRRVLSKFDQCRREFGMASLSMGEAASLAYPLAQAGAAQ